jgi:hypothetical protein
MNKKTTLLIAILLSFLVGFAVYRFYQTHEYKEVEIRTGFHGEARKNPLYAARLFLKRMGIPTMSKESVQGMGGFPKTDTVIIINSNRSSLSEKRTASILDWVKSGGHLIARATSDWSYFGKEDNLAKKADDEDEDLDEKKDYEDDINETMEKRPSRDPLQRMLGIRTGKRVSYYGDYDDVFDDDEDTDEDDESIADIFSTRLSKMKEHKIKLKNVSKELLIQRDWFYPLILEKGQASKSEQIKIDNHNFIIRQQVGKGMVTLVSDLGFINNYTLEQSDHAEILWQLVHGLHTHLNQPAEIWLINNDEMPSLWTLMWRYGWAFLVSLILLFLAWLLSSSRRFGPVIPKREEDRRSLNEHISSSGNFYWKHNKKQLLVDSSREALMQRLARIHPGWAHMQQDQQLQILVEQTGMKPALIHKLLFSDSFEQSEEFTYLIRQLENIRKASFKQETL